MGWMTRVQFLARGGILLSATMSRLSLVVRPASYPVGTQGPYPGVKADGLWLLTSI